MLSRPLLDLGRQNIEFISTTDFKTLPQFASIYFIAWHIFFRYQQCMENANYDMTRAMLGHQANFDLAFDALCLGIDRVISSMTYFMAEGNYFQVLLNFKCLAQATHEIK